MHRISLDNEEFEGNNTVYLLDSGDGIGLIDTGIATTQTRADLQEGLVDAGYSFDSIDTIVLTHWHPDHSGLAGEIQQASGATVYVHEADTELARGDQDALDAYAALQRDRFERWGIPEGKLTEILDFLSSWEHVRGAPAEVHTVSDGDRIQIGDTSLTVRHAPGHTDGSALLELDNDDVAFVGDTVLPVYTPNIGGADARVERPLATYLETLTSIASAGYDRLLPGHRSAIEHPAARAVEIIEHHHHRTERVLQVLEEHGPADPWTVSAHLFGDLHAVHIMHGPGEASAHLEHLHDHGVIDLEGGEYGPPTDDVSAADVLPPVPTP